MSENRTGQFANPVDEMAERRLFRDLRKIVFLNVSSVSDLVLLGNWRCTDREEVCSCCTQVRCTVVKRDGARLKQ